MKEIPVESDNAFWMITNAFIPGGTAPQARQGSLQSLTKGLMARARTAKPDVESDALSAEAA